ncbi:hypothetical protein H4Q26_006637 [Puccinia striiformis f. sp. tritici PST-130]|nr:hypothetical protein H4Q26_006637 [Puccinia striiformis f. sp. tritici PST-130]
MDKSAPLVDRVIYVCDLIQDLDMTPKEFINSFLEIKNSNLKLRRSYWSIPRAGRPPLHWWMPSGVSYSEPRKGVCSGQTTSEIR